MTVQELIDALKDFEPTMQVVTDGGDKITDAYEEDDNTVALETEV